MADIRFFYAPPVYATWPKLFVLTADGKLYTEYLDFMVPNKATETVDYKTFKEGDFLWNGYQSLKEITKEEALSKELRRQDNWIERYLSEISAL